MFTLGLEGQCHSLSCRIGISTPEKRISSEQCYIYVCHQVKIIESDILVIRYKQKILLTDDALTVCILKHLTFVLIQQVSGGAIYEGLLSGTKLALSHKRSQTSSIRDGGPARECAKKHHDG